ncbi:hypothetical protein SAMN02745135_02557 [Caloranaerobacter azorensis DSM 13643]|uniref:Uncharacterized protein n=1 Tax=Caloranaerobacter azorensis DSM 13643 TaxID=1121264 RepID=A0A1M5WNN7_9FIRM|nr:hypothetical protein [Caloranaerobacter azorensis]SHH88764.1 hypothetical protein SAMN02745135_02557 [Caloranaerobacter azorensis DSM 13643]
MAKVNYNLTYNERVVEAAKEYLARKERKVHPEGYFDNGGRWFPSENEKLICCSNIRRPSVSWPYSLMKHCRTMGHVAGLFGVLKKDVMRYLNKGILPEVEEGYYYKLVAVIDNKYFSIFDGKTQYEIGKTLIEEVKPDFEGGFYVYKTIKEAQNAVFPSTSKLLKATRAILKVKCCGNYCKYENGKIAFSEITPVEVVCKEVSNE